MIFAQSSLSIHIEANYNSAFPEGLIQIKLYSTAVNEDIENYKIYKLYEFSNEYSRH